MLLDSRWRDHEHIRLTMSSPPISPVLIQLLISWIQHATISRISTKNTIMIYGKFESGSENLEIQTKYLWPWIQNVADPRWNGHIGKVFELTEPVLASIWNAISALKRFFRITTETAVWIPAYDHNHFPGGTNWASLNTCQNQGSENRNKKHLASGFEIWTKHIWSCPIRVRQICDIGVESIFGRGRTN